MPSTSLLYWQNLRLPNLGHVDGQCVASLALMPPNPALVDENYRGYVLLLSAHFQGFCRDLYAECAQIVALKTRVTLQPLIQGQFTSNLRLDHGNPTAESLKEDFERFRFSTPPQRGRPSELGPHRSATRDEQVAKHSRPPRQSPRGYSARSGLAARLARCVHWPSDFAGWNHVYSTTEDSQATTLGSVRAEVLRMATKKISKPAKSAKATPVPSLKLGDYVKIRHSGWRRGRIVELRGPLGPNGSQIYRVIVRRKPKPAYIELREDQLEVIPAET
jgi:hypothetical protein